MKRYTVTVDEHGTIYWYKERTDIFHCEHGPAIIWDDGSQGWFIEGQLHREDGPAIVIADGPKYYYMNGQRHREDGPAIVYPCGAQYWYLKGREVTEQEFNDRVNPVEELTVAQIEELLGKRIKIVGTTGNKDVRRQTTRKATDSESAATHS